MSGWQDRLRRWRSLALAVLVALGPALAGAQTDPPADAPHETGAGSFLKKLWRGITGTDKHGHGKHGADAAPAEPAATPEQPPSLAQAQWIGFTPVLAVGTAEGAGAWIAGPFPEAGADGWVTDTVSGLTVAVRLVWREAEPGSLARLSAEAAQGLGLAPGAVAHVAVYRAR